MATKRNPYTRGYTSYNMNAINDQEKNRQFGENLKKATGTVGNTIKTVWNGLGNVNTNSNGVSIYPNNTTYLGYDVLPNFNTTPQGGTQNNDNTANKKTAKGGAYPSALAGNIANLTQPAGGGDGGGGGGGYGYIPTYNPFGRYNSPYQGKIDALMDALLNRDPFSYDYLSDPVYQSYRQQYEFQGDRARENAIGDYAANTGGLASSWANTRGQLRQNNYNAQLNGLIPELENARYNRYLGEIETDLNNLGQLQNLENMNYDRFLNDRNYDLQLQQLTQSGRRSRSRSSSSSQPSEQDERLARSNAAKIAMDVLNGGIMPTTKDLKELGTNSNEVNYYKKLIQKIQGGVANVGSKFSGGSSILI